MTLKEFLKEVNAQESDIISYTGEDKNEVINNKSAEETEKISFEDLQ